MARRPAFAGRSLLAMALGAALVIGLTLLRVADPYPLLVARETVFDYFQQLKPRDYPGVPIRIVAIDEASLAEIGQWPWSRNVLADITTRLADLGAAAIVFDVLFPEADRTSPSRTDPTLADYDVDFANALRGAPTVLGISDAPERSQLVLPSKTAIAISGSDPSNAVPSVSGLTVPIAPLSEATAGLGIITLGRADAGTVVRNLPLLWRDDARLLPGLGLEALRVAAGQSGLVVFGDIAGIGLVEAVRVGDWQVPTDATGSIRLYYRPLPAETYLSAAKLLTAPDTELRAALEGHIVLVGATASGLLDVRRTTLGEAVPGVSIHLQAIEQMASGVFLSRAQWVGGLEIALFALGGLILVIAVTLGGPKLGLLAGLVVLGLALGGSWIGFERFGVLIDASFTALATILLYAAMTFLRYAVTDADKRRMRSAFAHYVSPTLLDEIERNAASLELGGEVRDLSILFCDVRNYSTISQSLTPQALLGLLNGLFDVLGRSITGRNGTIDKFMGDAIMAFWNAPLSDPDHAENACRAALDMRGALALLNSGNRADDRPIALGIGIASGPALVGNVGSRERFDYSCIGETVNLASRIEDACKRVRYDILISDGTADTLAGFATLAAGSLELKGISGHQPVRLLVGDHAVRESQHFANLLAAHEDLCSHLAQKLDPQGALSACKALASAVEPGLLPFYEFISHRRSDFERRSDA